jgi:hypothetical protein
VPPLTRRTRRPAGAGRGVAAAALMVTSALAVAGCSTGNIASSTPPSNGQSFVAGSPGTTVFKSGTGPVAPPVSGPVVGGGKLALTAYRGHVVVLNFWGSWCAVPGGSPGLARWRTSRRPGSASSASTSGTARLVPRPS